MTWASTVGGAEYTLSLPSLGFASWCAGGAVVLFLIGAALARRGEWRARSPLVLAVASAIGLALLVGLAFIGVIGIRAALLRDSSFSTIFSAGTKQAVAIAFVGSVFGASGALLALLRRANGIGPLGAGSLVLGAISIAPFSSLAAVIHRPLPVFERVLASWVHEGHEADVQSAPPASPHWSFTQSIERTSPRESVFVTTGELGPIRVVHRQSIEVAEERGDLSFELRVGNRWSFDRVQKKERPLLLFGLVPTGRSVRPYPDPAIVEISSSKWDRGVRWFTVGISVGPKTRHFEVAAKNGGLIRDNGMTLTFPAPGSNETFRFLDIECHGVTTAPPLGGPCVCVPGIGDRGLVDVMAAVLTVGLFLPGSASEVWTLRSSTRGPESAAAAPVSTRPVSAPEDCSARPACVTLMTFMSMGPALEMKLKALGLDASNDGGFVTVRGSAADLSKALSMSIEWKRQAGVCDGISQCVLGLGKLSHQLSSNDVFSVSACVTR